MAEDWQHGTYRTARRPQRCRIVRGVYKQQRLTTHAEYYRSAAALVFTSLPPPVVFVGLLADEITLAPYVYPPPACLPSLPAPQQQQCSTRPPPGSGHHCTIHRRPSLAKRQPALSSRRGDPSCDVCRPNALINWKHFRRSINIVSFVKTADGTIIL